MLAAPSRSAADQHAHAAFRSEVAISLCGGRRGRKVEGVGVTEAVSALVRNILLRELAREECNICQEENGAMFDAAYETEADRLARGKAALEKG